MVKWNGPFRSDRSNRKKWSTSRGGPIFSKLFRLDRTVPFSFRPKFPEILVEWKAPLEVDHFFRLDLNRAQKRMGSAPWLDRSDRNGPFHLTNPTHSQSQYLAVRYFHVQHELTWRKTLSMYLLWIVNSRSIGDTRTSTCSYNRFGAASKAKGMFWLLTALKYVKDDLSSERIAVLPFALWRNTRKYEGK